MNKKYCNTCVYKGEYDGTPICRKGITLQEAIDLFKAPNCQMYEEISLKDIAKTLRETLEKGLKETKTPTLEEVKKEWEDLGYEVTIREKHMIIRQNYSSQNNFIHISKIFKKTYIRCVLSFQEHQLLTKTFRALGWIDV